MKFPACFYHVNFLKLMITKLLNIYELICSYPIPVHSSGIDDALSQWVGLCNGCLILTTKE